MPQPYRGYDKPDFHCRTFCVYCGDYTDCDSTEDHPVCEGCFYKYHNRDWTLRTDLVEPSDFVWGHDWQQRKPNG